MTDTTNGHDSARPNVGTITIPVPKLGVELSYDWEQLPFASVVYAATYGLRQIINDSHAPCVRKNYGSEDLWRADARKRVAERDAQLRSGNVPGTKKSALAIMAASLGCTEDELTAAMELVKLEKRQAAE